ncbi:murein biosynthesis integral membrane protein MurJ [Bacillota bacterium LX-D]|nr:murein biosynthesis integral membrane protein MurJ [Bacillota bacterium LX-D]
MSGKSVFKAAGIIMVIMVASRVIGFVRDVIIYSQFGQNRITDAYNAAFSIPDVLYMLLVGGALSSAFIPVFSKYISTKQEKEGWEVANIVLNLVMILMLIGIGVGYIYTRPLILLLVPGFNQEALELTVKLTRIMFWQAFFMAINGVTFGILNAYKIFIIPTLGTILYNLAIIVVGLIWSPKYGIAAFSVGVVIGAFLNFAIQIPDLRRIGYRYRFILKLNHPGLKNILGLMLPILIGLSIGQVNLFINQNLASALPAGIVAALHTGQRLMQVPIGIFAIAIAMTIFPTLTEQSANHKMAEFKQTANLGIRSVIFITLPAAAGLIALSVPTIRLLFEQGKFTHADTLVTSVALNFYSIGIFAQSALQVLNRIFYALQDTISPVVIGAFSIIINIAGSIILIRYLGHGGIALAYSSAGIFNLVLLLWWLKRKLGKIDGKRIILSFLQSLTASCLMGAAVYYTALAMDQILDMSIKLNQLVQVTLSILVGAAVYAVIAAILKNEETQMVLGVLKRKFKKGKK